MEDWLKCSSPCGKGESHADQLLYVSALWQMHYSIHIASYTWVHYLLWGELSVVSLNEILSKSSSQLMDQV